VSKEAPTFLCDAMLGGLARWLRAAGYDAEFAPGIADPDLVDRGALTGRIILSSDSGIFERNRIKRALVAALFIPRGLGTTGELAHVLKTMQLELRESRCMSCGGALFLVEKESARAEAPPRTFDAAEAFWRCSRCQRLLWRGTHWRRITAKLREASSLAHAP
jgi:uncharacterized protein